MRTIAAVNDMGEEAFVQAFGDVAEHSPWVAGRAFEARPFASREAMVLAFKQALWTASRTAQLTLIGLHPDLAKKARLTADSTREQQGAGLDSLTEPELAHFTFLNGQYRTKFGIPFIFAVKGATKGQILESFEQRIVNSTDIEFETALNQVIRILRFRIEDRVAL